MSDTPIAPLAPAHPRRGRPRKVQVELSTLTHLSLADAVLRCRELGQPRGKAKIAVAVANGLVVAVLDDDHLTWQGKPQMKVDRESLEAWLRRALRPYVPVAHAVGMGTARHQRKGPAATGPRSRG